MWVPCHIENGLSQVMDLDGLNICTVAPNNNTFLYLAKQSTLHSFHITADSASHTIIPIRSSVTVHVLQSNVLQL